MDLAIQLSKFSISDLILLDMVDMVFIVKYSQEYHFLIVKQYSTINDLRVEIHRQLGIQAEEQELECNGKVLKEGWSLGNYNISYVSVTLTRRSYIFALEKKVLDPQYDFDLTNLKDDGRLFTRGGWKYQRPYGWKRIGLNVKNKYESDDWLGTGRYNACWAVSYHGTTKLTAEEISRTKYDLRKGKRFHYGVGIYSTPDPDIAEKFSTTFLHQEKKYKVILQNRVNLWDTKYLPEKNYFLTYHEENIRPYGILYKEV